MTTPHKRPPLLALQTIYPIEARNIGKYALKHLRETMHLNGDLVRLEIYEACLAQAVSLTHVVVDKYGIITWAGRCPFCFASTLRINPGTDTYFCSHCEKLGHSAEFMSLRPKKPKQQ